MWIPGVRSCPHTYMEQGKRLKSFSVPCDRTSRQPTFRYPPGHAIIFEAIHTWKGFYSLAPPVS
jgi:hypothetical protein